MYLQTQSATRKRRRERSQVKACEKSKSRKERKTYQGSQAAFQRVRMTKRQEDKELSLFEQLPKEVLQDIHILGMNCSLPLASLYLQSCLTSTNIFLNFSMNVLHPDMGGKNPCLAAQTRLLDCRFFTFAFMRQYIAWAYDRHAKKRRADNLKVEPFPDYGSDIYSYICHAKSYVQLEKNIIAPEKLFCEPWKDGKMNFVRFLMVITDFELDKTSRRDAALQGIKQAISADIIPPLFRLSSWLGDNVASWQDLLEHAVNIRNINQVMLGTILREACVREACLQLSESNWDAAIKGADGSERKYGMLLLALKEHVQTEHHLKQKPYRTRPHGDLRRKC